MAEIINYRDDANHCFSQLKFENGERILVSIGSGSIEVYKLILWGLLPISVVWKAEVPDDTAFLFESESDFQRRPLELIVERIRHCRSIKEVNSRLA